MRRKRCANLTFSAQFAILHAQVHAIFRYLLRRKLRKSLMVEHKVHTLVVLYARKNNITVVEATYELLPAGLYTMAMPLDEAQRHAVRQ